MKKKSWILLLMVLVLVAALVVSGCSGEEDPGEDPGTEPGDETTFPENPVKIIVARKAGGSSDTIARMFQPSFQKHLGANVIVENVTGAGGKIGNDQAWKADADGYTLLMGVFPSDVLTGNIEGGVDYKMNEFTPIYNIQGGETSAVVVPADSPYDTLEDLVAAAKADPGQITIAMPGGLSNSALGYAMLAGVTEIEMERIPYDGGNEALQAVMGGHVDVTVANAMNTFQPAEEGKIKVLSVFSPEKLDQLPDVPTFASVYGDEYSYITFVGLLAPQGLPEDVQAILEDAAEQAVADPDFANAVGDAFSIMGMDSEEFSAQIQSAYDMSEDFRSYLEALLEE